MTENDKKIVTVGTIMLSALAGIGSTFTAYILTIGSNLSILYSLLTGYMVAGAVGMAGEVILSAGDKECDFCG